MNKENKVYLVSTKCKMQASDTVENLLKLVWNFRTDDKDEFYFVYKKDLRKIHFGTISDGKVIKD